MKTQGQRRAGDKGAGNASPSARKMTVIWNLANVPLERQVKGPNEKARPVCQGKGWGGVCSLGLVLDPPHCLREVRGSGMKARRTVIKPYKGFMRTTHTRSLPMKLTDATSS